MYLKHVSKRMLKFRGTRDFEVEVSKDGNSWTAILNDTLNDLAGLSCDNNKPDRVQSFTPSAGALSGTIYAR